MSFLVFFIIGVVVGYVAWLIYDTHKPKQTSFVISQVRFNGLTIKGVIREMEFKYNQKATVTANPVDENGNAASIEAGTAVWSSSDESICTVEVNPDNELEATVRSFSSQGSTSISLEADGDPGSGVATIFGSADVRVLGPNAVGFNLSFGEAGPVEDRAPEEPAPVDEEE